MPIPAGGKREPDLELSTEAVANANILVQVSGARVVVTSSWRIGRSVAELTKLLKSWGCKFFVYDKIPSDDDEDRGGDILAWLGDDAAHYVVLDDDPTDLAPVARHLVMPRPDVGLQFHDVQEALRILERT